MKKRDNLSISVIRNVCDMIPGEVNVLPNTEIVILQLLHEILFAHSEVFRTTKQYFANP